MAEIAAGAVVAEQVISTTIEGGAIAGYAVSKSTMPLKATFQQIGKADPKFLNDTTLALARANHTLNIIDGKAYIFGGEFSPGKLCSSDFHAITFPTKEEEHDTIYSCIPPVGEGEGKEKETPCPRSKHAMCVQGHELALFGGCDEEGHAVDQDSCIWIWNTSKLMWRKIETSSHKHENAGTPPPRFNHKLFAYNGHLLLHGGESSEGNFLNDTWFLDLISNTWSRLPDVPIHSDSVALADGVLYSISQQATESFAHVHTLEIGDGVPANDPATLLTSLQWVSVSTASHSEENLPPHSRIGAGLIPITTGYGRQYLTYFFGFSPASTSQDPNQPKPKDKDSHSSSHSNPTFTSNPHPSSTPDSLTQLEPKPEPAPLKSSTPTEPKFYPDFWTLQTPSKSTKPTTWTDFKPAAIKDGIRNAFGISSGNEEWAEVEVQAMEQLGHEGKVHPGPRAFFGVDGGGDGRSVVLWGGVNGKGEMEGDGWVVRLS